MTRPHDQNQPGPGDSGDDELKRRLDQARAELTGHVPVPDQRLEMVFLAGRAPLDVPAAVEPIEPSSHAPSTTRAVKTIVIRTPKINLYLSILPFASKLP